MSVAGTSCSAAAATPQSMRPSRIISARREAGSDCVAQLMRVLAVTHNGGLDFSRGLAAPVDGPRARLLKELDER